MANIRSLGDFAGNSNNNNNTDDKKGTSSFAGGERSGLAIENPNRPDAEFASSAVSGPPPDGAKKVCVYKNGFTVENGPFRALGDPNNDRFMQELKAGYAPRELQEGGRDVHIVLEDRRNEDYVPPPKPKYELFEGDGQSLSTHTSSTAAPVNAQNGEITINNDLPTTALQFRFPSGERLTQTFNQSHTIGDVHSYVMQVSPVNGSYKLVEGFPPQEICSDTSMTLKDAGLLNAAITQKLV